MFSKLFNKETHDHERDNSSADECVAEEKVICSAENIKKKNSFEKRVKKELNAVVEHFTSVDKKSFFLVQRKLKTKEEFLEEVVEHLKIRNNDEEVVETVLIQFERYVWGYHVLEDLINDPDISDIKVLDEKSVRVKKNGKRMCAENVSFESRDEYKQFVDYVATKNSKNISDITAVQTFTDSTSNENFILRFNISTQYVNSHDLPYLQIRKIPKIKRTVDDLINLGFMDRKTADYLIEKARDGSSIVFCGKGASGKTTIMNALLDYIPHDKSCLIIQENEELFSKTHPEMMFQHVVTNKGEGKIRYTLKDLAINGLLTDIDYFIIGEIKGGEALYLLNASYTGAVCWTSIHSNKSTEALDKMADYAKYESSYSKNDLMNMLTSLSTVVFVKDFKITEISEVVGWDHDSDDIKYKRIV